MKLYYFLFLLALSGSSQSSAPLLRGLKTTGKMLGGAASLYACLYAEVIAHEAGHWVIDIASGMDSAVTIGSHEKGEKRWNFAGPGLLGATYPRNNNGRLDQNVSLLMACLLTGPLVGLRSAFLINNILKRYGISPFFRGAHCISAINLQAPSLKGDIEGSDMHTTKILYSAMKRARDETGSWPLWLTVDQLYKGLILIEGLKDEIGHMTTKHSY